MITCWARVLQECNDVQSREHYLSRAIIGSGNVTISGLPFLHGKARAIPGERLVAKILCKRHNELLSPLDAAAGHFFQVLKAFKKRGIMRAHGAKKPGGIDMYEVAATLVERWMLKTVINVMFERRIDPDIAWYPPETWVRCAFALRPFPEWCGLYLLTGESSSHNGALSAIGIRPLTKGVDGKELIGAQFQIEELQFVLAMEPLGDIHRTGYRIQALKDKPSLDLRQIIHFRWTKPSSRRRA